MTPELLELHTISPSIRQDRTLRWFTASIRREAICPVVAPSGNQPDAHGIPPGHSLLSRVLRPVRARVCARVMGSYIEPG